MEQPVSLVFRHDGRKSSVVSMAAEAFRRLAGPCECSSDRCRTHRTPSQCQSGLTVWRRHVGNHRDKETGPGNHQSASRQTEDSKQRFLTPFPHLPESFKDPLLAIFEVPGHVTLKPQVLPLEVVGMRVK